MDDDYERVLGVKNEVFVYKIPPRQNSRGHRADDWKLDQPDWTGRLRIVLVNGKCFLKLEDRTSGELFAQAPIDQYPGPAVEAVLDSSRYFVIKIVDVTGRHAFIGMGFTDRGDSFDFNVTLQDHFKREKVQDKIEPEAVPLDLAFKEGQTIKINIAPRPGMEAKPRIKKLPTGGGLLPPPPSGTIPKIPPIPAKSSQPCNVETVVGDSTATPESTKDEWGDFSSFADATPTPDSDWVQF